VRYVITGGPCTGKTTLLEGLARKGTLNLPESARQIIAEEQNKPYGVLPWTDLERFQYEVIKRQQQNEKRTKSGIYFLDRGLVDCLAYIEKDGIQPSNKMYSQIKSASYDKVFLLDQLDVYENDSGRKEDRFEAGKIHGHIEAAYKFLGYDIIRVPNMGKKERLNFVLGGI